MAVRWPDGSYTGSVRVEKLAPIPVVVESEPEDVQPEKGFTKEVKDGSR